MIQEQIDSTRLKIDAGAAALSSIRGRLLIRRELLLRLRAELARLTVKSAPDRPAPPDAQTPHFLAESILPEAICAEPMVPAVEVPAPPAVEPVAPEPLILVAPELALAETAAPTLPLIEPVVQEAALEEPTLAAATESSPRGSPLLRALPILCLIAAFAVITRYHVSVRAALPKVEASATPVAASDDRSAEALALARQWHMAGDDRSLFERLGGVAEHPGGVPAWHTEMVDADSYLVVYRELAGTPVYAFEVNLKARTVLPTPEATNRLTLIRVRDEATSQLNALSRSNHLTLR